MVHMPSCSLKILHIAPFFHGGVGRVALNLTKAFISLGCKVVLAIPVEIPEELRDLVEEYYALRNPTMIGPLNTIQFYSLNREKIKDIVKLEKPDIVLTHGPLVLVSKAVKSVPLVSVVHGTYANEVRWMRYHPIFGLERVRYITSIYATHRLDMTIYKISTQLSRVYLVAVSRNTRRELIEAGVREDKVFSILNGVDKEVFKPMNKDYAKTLVEEMFDVKLKNRVFLHVNPGPRKGTHTLIKAIALLRKVYGNDFTLLIVGRLGPKTYREYVEDMIRGFKLEDNVKLLEYVENEKLPVVYNAADLTVVPSFSEGGPLVTPESLACETPVVATDVGGNPEYLGMMGSTRLLVSVRKYEFSLELAEKLVKALTKKMHVDSTIAPSWNDIALKYMDIVKGFIAL